MANKHHMYKALQFVYMCVSCSCLWIGSKADRGSFRYADNLVECHFLNNFQYFEASASETTIVIGLDNHRPIKESAS